MKKKERDNDVDVSANLVSAIVNLSRGEVERLHSLTYEDFLNKTNAHEHVLDEGMFKEFKRLAHERLVSQGMTNPKDETLGEGTYLIVGDSHGKHTRTKMFDLLKSLQREFNFRKVIHIGHILDDDNMISYWWKDFENLIVLAKQEELAAVESHRITWGSFSIIREGVQLGDLSIRNQDLITDYVKTSIKSLDQQIFDQSVVVNCHRHEWFSRCAFRQNVSTISPGCVCEPHIVKTVKQIDFTAGYQVREARPDGFIKYRRMRDMYRFWEQGVLIVHVDEDGDYTVIPCRIQMVEGKYTTAYKDKIYTEDGSLEPELKVFINTDVHSPDFDPSVLALQDEFVKGFKPDVYVNLGDMQNNFAYNHHVIDRGEVIAKHDSVDADASVFFLLRRMAEWAPVRYLMYGNHERFVKDFAKRMPQYTTMFQGALNSAVAESDYTLCPHKDVLTVGEARCIHGDTLLFGQTGSLLEKVARAIGKNTIVGHLHSTSIRFGCYMLGMSGKLGQGYNEETSSWNHGFGTCLQYGGKAWITPWCLCHGKLHTDEKMFQCGSGKDWEVPKFRYKVVYEFDPEAV